jgi:hypothetical protein
MSFLAIPFFGENRILCASPLISTSNLQVYCKLDGNANDSSGNGNNGVATSMTYGTGKFGSCGTFSSGKYITLPTKAYGIANNYTISAWIKSSYTGTTQFILSADVVASARVFQFKIEPNGDVYLVRFSSTPAVVANFGASSSVLNGQWHHIATTFNSAVGSIIYIDGLPSATNSNTTLNNNTAGTKPIIGVFNDLTTAPMVGDIDDLSFWNRTLSATEILTLAGNCPLT